VGNGSLGPPGVGNDDSDSWLVRGDTFLRDTSVTGDRGFPAECLQTDVTRHSDPSDLFAEPAYRFWFLIRERDRLAAFERDGTAERLDGEVLDLMGLYQSSDRRIWPLTDRVIGDQLR